MNELQRQVRDYLCSESRLSPDLIGTDTKLISSGLVDSFVVVGLVSFLEQATGVGMPSEYIAVEHLDSLNLIDELVRRLSGTI
jgi:acyl carrier protein